MNNTIRGRKFNSATFNIRNLIVRETFIFCAHIFVQPFISLPSLKSFNNIYSPFFFQKIS